LDPFWTPAGPQGSLFGYPEGQRVAYAAFEAAVRSRATAGPQGSLFGYPEGQLVVYAAFEAPVWSRAAAGPQGSLFGYPEGQRVAYAAFEAPVGSRDAAGPQGILFGYPGPHCLHQCLHSSARPVVAAGAVDPAAPSPRREGFRLFLGSPSITF